MKLNRRIILASTSPRRKELLKKTGLSFAVVVSDYDEDMTLALPPAELAKYLSRGKAEAVAKHHPDAIIIAADTFVVYDGTILGKPHTPERAKEMLWTLGEPLDKAGAYGIQGAGKALVDHVEGDHDNVIGLPVTAVLEALKHFI